MTETVQESSEQQAGTFSREFGRRAVAVEDKLSKNDQRIVAYLRENLDELPFHTADSLAVAASVSRAAIVRLAHRLGYEGFAELRQLALEDLKTAERSPLARFQASGEAATQFGRKLEGDRENLALTQMLSEQELQAAAETLTAANSVSVIGNGVSAGLALYLHRILHGVRPGVLFVEATFPDALSRLSEGDAVVALLFRRYSRLTVALLDRARELGASVILISDGGGQRFAGEGDSVLIGATESPTLYQSMVGPVFLIEALVAATAASDSERTRRTLESREQFNTEQHLLIGEQPESGRSEDADDDLSAP